MKQNWVIQFMKKEQSKKNKTNCNIFIYHGDLFLYMCSSSSPSAEGFQNVFLAPHLILAAQSSITNIVFGRPDAASAGRHRGPLISSADGYEARQQRPHCLTANKEDKADEEGTERVTNTPLNKHVMVERTPLLMAAADTETSSF